MFHLKRQNYSILNKMNGSGKGVCPGVVLDTYLPETILTPFGLLAEQHA
jgi:hypothetical protein